MELSLKLVAKLPAARQYFLWVMSAVPRGLFDTQVFGKLFFDGLRV